MQTLRALGTHFQSNSVLNTVETKTIKLPDSFIDILVNLPETEMGYQIVKVILRNGKVLHGQKVLNSELLMLEKDELIQARDIVNIELESK